ncbi:MAG: hypothetical protein AAF616_08060 [Bacteroidota bacterium]
MEIANNLILDDQYKLKISSKKLASGRFQVKFSATIKGGRRIYGYVLVDPSETLKSVTGKIKDHLQANDQSHDHQHLHLPTIGKSAFRSPNFLIFQ